MIISQIIGGLGNQMFQVACGLSVAKNANTSLKLDVSAFDNYKLHHGFELNSVFSGEFEIASREEISEVMGVKKHPMTRKVLRKLNKGNAGSNYVIEPTFKYWPDIARIRNNTYLEGYWQSEKYFQGVSSIVHEKFTFKGGLKDLNEKIFSEMLSKNSVSLHIRRGDYISNKKNMDIYNVCSLQYYKDAIHHMEKHIPNAVYYVFSDDIAWAKQNLTSKPFVFVDHNHSNNSYLDMRLMSYCKHNIIANSSFSWWAAWLNSNDEKIVIAPYKWFNNDASTEDLIPKSWVTL